VTFIERALTLAPLSLGGPPWNYLPEPHFCSDWLSDANRGGNVLWRDDTPDLSGGTAEIYPRWTGREAVCRPRERKMTCAERL
jgi:hypothetical protein